MVELRKRPPPKETATPAPAAKRGPGAGAKVKKLVHKAQEAVAPSKSTKRKGGATAATTANETAATNGTAATAETGKIGVGSKIELDGFGGTVQTHDGASTTFKELLDKSSAGVVVFTYPRASTPGCTTQACLFRDSYAPITGASLAVYGLSTDSPKANTTFATKHSLPFPLLCDPGATLTSALGMKKTSKSAIRGVVVVDKQGTVRVWQQAGPQKTLDLVLEYIKTEGTTEGAPAAEDAAKSANQTPADPEVKTAEEEKQEGSEEAAAAEVGQSGKD